MTSRRPYWCPKTMKRWPCWCSKPILWELYPFLMQTLSFVPILLHRCWPREWKHSIVCLFSLSPTSSRNLKLTIVKKRIMAGELPLQARSKSFHRAGIFFLGVIQIFTRIWKTKGAHSVTAVLFVVLIMPITPRYSLWNLRYYLWMEIFELRVKQIFSQALYQTLQTTKVKFSVKEYYRMPRRHEHISFVFSSAFRDIFS